MCRSCFIPLRALFFSCLKNVCKGRKEEEGKIKEKSKGQNGGTPIDGKGKVGRREKEEWKRKRMKRTLNLLFYF